MSVFTHDWTAAARCREIGVDAFFADGDGSNHYALARRVCGACPVRVLCLDTAMRAEGDISAMERGGMWGGLTPNERRALYERATRAAA